MILPASIITKIIQDDKERFGAVKEISAGAISLIVLVLLITIAFLILVIMWAYNWWGVPGAILAFFFPEVVFIILLVLTVVGQKPTRR